MQERLQRLIEQIPGYTGYRTKERRRDEDRGVRERLAAKLMSAAGDIDAVALELANQRRLDLIQSVWSLSRRIGHLVDKVSSTSTGYAGLFSDRDVDEGAIDQLRRFDEEVESETTTLLTLAGSLKSQVGTFEEVNATVSKAMAELDRLDKLWDHRERVIESARPSAEQEVLALLDNGAVSTSAITPPTITPGTALSIAGEDFVVTQLVYVDAAPTSLHLARLDEGPSWLLILDLPEKVFARVSRNSDQSEPSGSAIAEGQGNSNVTSNDGQAKAAAVKFAVQADTSNERVVWVSLDWGTERRVYHGKQLDVSDIEVFGQPAG